MTRRDFLAASTAFTVPVMLNGFGLKAMTRQSALVQSLMQSGAVNTDRVLVIVYLNGGNDGLNTVIPLDQLPTYNTLRSPIALPENSLLRLQGTDKMAFHPAMTGMRNLYNDGRLTVINSVSYPNPDQSHFRSTDIWMTAANADVSLTTGWAGRYLEDRFPGYPVGFPNEQMEDPLAIQIGYLTSTALLGSQQSMGVAINDPEAFYQLVGAGEPTSPNDIPGGDAGTLISFIRLQQALAVGYAGEIKNAFDAGQTLGTYPLENMNNSLAEQLKIVARLIHGGLKTKIFFVALGGFDTHSGQIVNSPVTGPHADLLGKVSDALYAFQEDLRLQGTQDRVVGMTFSDFGRRANANASNGTDHGVAAPQFVFGSSVRHQVIGTNPNLSDLIESYGGNKDVKMQIDFRRIYADLLNDWFETGRAKADNLLLHNFPTISLFSDVCETLTSGPWNSPTTWTVGRVPMSGEKIRVNAGHVVTLSDVVSVRSAQVQGTIRYGAGGKIRITG
ncbi:DUF1501 domain-containing protein [Fibrella forsythiae]|uniref:DUF1501 domain-containing protein n=1 Tax=Fibrella forsythiae TaxID=2817061 RepID=A0ABS3JSC5_9BACT|nr:DUF1501 domain-containing protein [Fibrella forsythiae]MBO0952094.1 DUF1501 domain-containing protein [Fibrella forsythiae]